MPRPPAPSHTTRAVARFVIGLQAQGVEAALVLRGAHVDRRIGPRRSRVSRCQRVGCRKQLRVHQAAVCSPACLEAFVTDLLAALGRVFEVAVERGSKVDAPPAVDRSNQGCSTRAS